jgi:glycosyltransferase involved in cell wall biosynthesis
MSQLRVLILAPDCNPESVTTPSIAYAHAEALARLHSVTLVVREGNELAIRRAAGPFHTIEPIRLPFLDPLYSWALRRVFKYDYGRQSLTAATYPLQIAFEWRAWRQLRTRIRAGNFDVVLRILPIVPVLPSPFAYFLRRGPIPFVIGPLNGGLPWPSGFPQLERQRRQAGYWVSSLRGLYRYLPFARSTYSRAAAIIAGSSHTFAEFESYREKLFFVPGENGIDSASLVNLPRSKRVSGDRLQLVFIGRLIPLKACDIALRAAAALARSGKVHFTIIGDGPERPALEQLAKSLSIENAVTFTGWVDRSEVLARLRQSDILVFPSLREFGGGVVFEALSLGVVPVVVKFGGPGDIVTPDVGFRLPLIDERTLIEELGAVLARLVEDDDHVDLLRRRGIAYAREKLTWDGKALAVSEVLQWVVGRRSKPVLQPDVR